MYYLGVLLLAVLEVSLLSYCRSTYFRLRWLRDSVDLVRLRLKVRIGIVLETILPVVVSSLWEQWRS